MLELSRVILALALIWLLLLPKNRNKIAIAACAVLLVGVCATELAQFYQRKQIIHTLDAVASADRIIIQRFDQAVYEYDGDRLEPAKSFFRFGALLRSPPSEIQGYTGTRHYAHIRYYQGERLLAKGEILHLLLKEGTDIDLQAVPHQIGFVDDLPCILRINKHNAALGSWEVKSFRLD